MVTAILFYLFSLKHYERKLNTGLILYVYIFILKTIFYLEDTSLDAVLM